MNIFARFFKKEKDPYANVSEELLRCATLDNIMDVIGSSPPCASVPKTQSEITRTRNKLNQLTDQVQGYPSKILKDRYLRWIDHFNRCLNEAEQELKTHEYAKIRKQVAELELPKLGIE